MTPLLYAPDGRPVDLGLLHEEQAAPTMAGIRNIYSVTHPSVGLTPQRLVSILRDAEIGDPYFYLALAEEMEEKDLHYNAVLGVRKHAVAHMEISVQAASSNPEDIYDADLVRDILLEGDLDFETSLFDILDAVGKGFSATEIIWDRDEVPWRPQRLEWRDPRWFMFDWISGQQVLVRTLRTGGQTVNNPPATGAAHLAPMNIRSGTGAQIGIQPATEPLHPFKFITHIAKAKSGLPIRGGIARLAGWAYLFKNYILKDWVTFAETFGQPLRVGKYGTGASEADKQKLLQAVSAIGTDAAAIVPATMLIEFVESNLRASPELYEGFCDYIDNQVSKGVLGQTLTTQLPRGGGSKAAASVHNDVRKDIALADAKQLGACLSRDLVRPIVKLNRGERKRYPKIAIGYPDEEDLEAFSKSIAPLIDRGLPVSQKGMLGKFGLSEPAHGEPILHPVAKETGQLAGAEPAPKAPDESPQDSNLAGLFTDVDGEQPRNGHVEVASTRRRSAPSSTEGVRTTLDRGQDGLARSAPLKGGGDGDAIDRFVEKLRNQSDEAMAPIIRPLMAEIRKAKNFTDAKHRVVAAVQRMNPDKFVEMIAQAAMQMNLAGNAGLKLGKRRRRK
ncbi:MAG TPA: DUF935 domain-containing protein [Candidatus Binataceae bacterium]|nr:DUF935 domain-containing protein [Candidatus Binataceae bacterium]